MESRPQPDDFRPVFVIGCPRSGTTLLATLLGRHSELAATPERGFMLTVAHRLRPILDRGATAVAAELDRTRVRDMKVPRDTLIERLTLERRLDLPDVLRAVLEIYAEVRGKPRTVEKTPGHIRHVEQLHAWFPGARFVWIVRDPRGCVASLRKVDFARHHGTTGLSLRWVRDVGFALRAEARLQDVVKRVSYESLLKSPTAVVTELDTWLGIPFQPTQLDELNDAGTVPSQEMGWKANVMRPILADRIEAWRQELPREDIARVTAVTRPLLKDLGYDLLQSPSARTVVPSLVGAAMAAVSRSSVCLDVMSALERAVQSSEEARRQRVERQSSG